MTMCRTSPGGRRRTAIETHRISYAFVWPSAKEKDHSFFRSCFFSSFGALSFTNTRLGMMNESNVKCTRREKIDEIQFFFFLHITEVSCCVLFFSHWRTWSAIMNFWFCFDSSDNAMRMRSLLQSHEGVEQHSIRLVTLDTLLLIFIFSFQIKNNSHWKKISSLYIFFFFSSIRSGCCVSEFMHCFHFKS